MHNRNKESTERAVSQDRQRPLFAPDLHAWVSSENNAFTQALVERSMLPRTVRQYEIHWLHFVEWLKANQICLSTADHTTIKTFLAALTDAKLQQRERYQHVIKMAMDIMLEQPGSHNPARLASDSEKTSWRKVDANDDTQFLTHSERKTIIAMIRHSPEHLVQINNAKTTLILWRYLRLRAMVCLFLGAGAKVSEAINLSVSCMRPIGSRYMIDYSDYIHQATGAAVPAAQDALHAFKGRGKGVDRTVTMPVWCTKPIDDWLRVCSDARGLLFPSSPAGGAMSPSTVARNVDQFSKLCGIDFTAQQLRNAFGAVLIEAGQDDKDLTRLMGFSDSGGAMSAWRLRTNFDKWLTKQSAVAVLS